MKNNNKIDLKEKKERKGNDDALQETILFFFFVIRGLNVTQFIPSCIDFNARVLLFHEATTIFLIYRIFCVCVNSASGKRKNEDDDGVNNKCLQICEISWGSIATHITLDSCTRATVSCQVHVLAFFWCVCERLMMRRRRKRDEGKFYLVGGIWVA